MPDEPKILDKELNPGWRDEQQPIVGTNQKATANGLGEGCPRRRNGNTQHVPGARTRVTESWMPLPGMWIIVATLGSMAQAYMPQTIKITAGGLPTTGTARILSA
jgi:hypothetical protein